MGEGDELNDDEGENFDDAGDNCVMLLLYRNSASSRFSRSVMETPGGRLKHGLDTLLYARFFLLRDGVDTSRKPSSISLSS